MSPPRVDVVIPAYRSETTIAACLDALRDQTYRDFQTIVVDSTPGEQVAEIVGKSFPEVRFIRSQQRLLPHAARNLGVESGGDGLLAFTDPDIYPAPDWLERMVESQAQFGGVIVGSILSHNRDWLGIGIHIAKFDMFLPSGPPRPAALVMTGSLLLPHQLFAELGGFAGGEVLADLLLSWEIQRQGVRATFVPSAVVYHDHQSTAGEFSHERFVRGGDFARLRVGEMGWGKGRILAHLGLTVLPTRLAHLLWRSASCAMRAGQFGDYVMSFPILVLGHAAWLMGEAREYAGLLVGGDGTQAPCAS